MRHGRAGLMTFVARHFSREAAQDSSRSAYRHCRPDVTRHLRRPHALGSLSSRTASRWNLKVAIGFIAAVVGLTSLAAPAWAGQYYEEATSGTGSTNGTGVDVTFAWNQWPVPENSVCTLSLPYCFYTGSSLDPSGEGFTDSAAWLINANNRSQSIEVGFGSGYAPGVNGGWTNAMQPYYTTANGSSEVNATSAYDLVAGVPVWMAMAVGGCGGTCIQVTQAPQGPNWSPSTTYTVPCCSRTNFAQSETAYGDDWMNGGAGVNWYMYYGNSSGWQLWGENTCTSKDTSNTHQPFNYYNTCNVGGSPSEYNNRGYGNGSYGS